MSYKIYRVSEVQVSQYLQHQDSLKFKLAIFQKSRVSKVQVSIFFKSKVSKVRVGIVPKTLKLELELMNHDTFSSASLLTTLNCYQSNT
jgi:hypothetical protein